MISTGTDIKPLECLLFMRDVKSRVYFEQMKGRGTRTISKTDLNAVSPDIKHKTHFVIVDAVGVTESDKTDSQPLERKKTVSFDRLVKAIAIGQRDEDTLVTMAGRLSKLNVKLEKDERKELLRTSAGEPLGDIVNGLLDAADPDKQIEEARRLFKVEDPSEDQIAGAAERLVRDGCQVFNNPAFRETLIRIRSRQDQIMDTVSRDAVLSAQFETGQAEEMIQSFRDFMEAHKDELLALQIIYNQPYDKRHVTYEMIRHLAETMKKPPYNLNTGLVWTAFAQLDKDRVKKHRPEHLLTDIISLVRFGLSRSDGLAPFQESVDQRFESWLQKQKEVGSTFTEEQMEWLILIKDHIAASLEIKVEDFDNVPFHEKGGVIKVFNLFGEKFTNIISELNEVLAV